MKHGPYEMGSNETQEETAKEHQVDLDASYFPREEEKGKYASSRDEMVNLEGGMNAVMLGCNLNVRDAGQVGLVDMCLTKRMALRRVTGLMPNTSANGTYNPSMNNLERGQSRMQECQL
ncbi:hypothetical protein GOP47_0026267 [Adiantum capillus-veneris]|nr:hypothetical protein GOP47_0026267 [Adiantum capillus-veneris]